MVCCKLLERGVLQLHAVVATGMSVQAALEAPIEDVFGAAASVAEVVTLSSPCPAPLQLHPSAPGDLALLLLFAHIFDASFGGPKRPKCCYCVIDTISFYLLSLTLLGAS